MAKAIIDGVRYDTEAEGVEEVVSWSNGYGTGDFNHCYETLYKTGKGSWFLEGSGGPMSKYRKSAGSGWSGSSGNITPMSPDEVYDWLERIQESSVIEKHFPEEVVDA